MSELEQLIAILQRKLNAIPTLRKEGYDTPYTDGVEATYKEVLDLIRGID